MNSTFQFTLADYQISLSFTITPTLLIIIQPVLRGRNMQTIMGLRGVYKAIVTTFIEPRASHPPGFIVFYRDAIQQRPRWLDSLPDSGQDLGLCYSASQHISALSWWEPGHCFAVFITAKRDITRRLGRLPLLPLRHFETRRLTHVFCPTAGPCPIKAI